MNLSSTDTMADITLAMKIYNDISPQLSELGTLILKLKNNLTVADIVQLQAEVADARRENEIALENTKPK